ncbi:MAG: MFS transporter [Chloroflexota bacterium]
MSENNQISFQRLVGVSLGVKFLNDVANQMAYPFMPILAQGLGVNLVVMGQLVSLRSAMGLLTPIFGSLADQHGDRRILRVCQLLAVVGLLVTGLSTNVWMAAIGLVITGVGIHAFVPIIQTYVSARLPYARRAQGMGIVEYSWALAGIIGLYLVGLLMDATSWRAPFFVLAVGIFVSWIVMGTMPEAVSNSSQAERKHPLSKSSFSLSTIIKSTRSFFDLGANARSTYGFIAAQTLVFIGGFTIMFTYGAWFQDEFALTASQLGVMALLFGIFDLVGSIAVSLYTDKIGKRNSVMIGSVIALIGYLITPFAGNTLFAIAACLLFARAGFEFAVVAGFALLSEQVPEKRGKVMSLGSASVLAGSALTSTMAPWIYVNLGTTLLCLSCVVWSGLSLILLLTIVQEAPETEDNKAIHG